MVWKGCVKGVGMVWELKRELKRELNPRTSKFAQIGLAGRASTNRVVIKLISNSPAGSTRCL